MRTWLLWVILLTAFAACGPLPAATPPGTFQPAAQPTAGSSTVPVIARAEDAIALAQARLPQLRDIKRKLPGTIGASTDIVVQERSGGWNLVFWMGSGDCPSGCINNHYWYVSVEQSGQISLAGEYIREFDSATNSMKASGSAQWGIPRE